MRFLRISTNQHVTPSSNVTTNPITLPLRSLPYKTMIVPFPITFTLNFSVGMKYVMVEMNLMTGDDSQEVVTQFIQKEHIPIYLETNILCAVEAFLREAIQFEKDEEDEGCGMSFSPFFLSFLSNILPFIFLTLFLCSFGRRHFPEAVNTMESRIY